MREIEVRQTMANGSYRHVYIQHRIHQPNAEVNIPKASLPSHTTYTCHWWYNLYKRSW